MNRITDIVNKQLAAQEAVDEAVKVEQEKRLATIRKATSRDGVNYCRCCGGSVKCVGPLNNKGVCGDCAAEYSKPEYHKNGDEQEQENDNEGV